MNNQEFLALIDKYLAGEASENEIDLLVRYYQSFQGNDDWNEKELGVKGDSADKIFSRIQKGILVPRRPKIFTIGRMAAAAAVIGLLLAGKLLLVNRHDRNEIVQENGKKNDVLPGRDRAILTLANGSTVTLDDAKNGTLAQQGAAKVVKIGGKLAYGPTNADSKEVLYNTVSTPRGGTYQIELTDGSKVWLNAESSLRFPTAFAGKQRRVEVTGEAYFEVADRKSMPFVVSVNGAEVQVLGTHFDVMAYSDEDALKTTLLEGAVKFVSGGNTSLLRPGQQSQLTRDGKDGQIKVVNDVDVDEVIAWKNGLFQFEKADIGTVMRQLARWYDVDVEYRNKREGDLLHVEIPRNTKLSDVLKALEVAGAGKFELEGKSIIVTR